MGINRQRKLVDLHQWRICLALWFGVTGATVHRHHGLGSRGGLVCADLRNDAGDTRHPYWQDTNNDRLKPVMKALFQHSY